MDTRSLKKIHKYNGQYVTATLLFLGGKATKNELLNHVVLKTRQPNETVEHELIRILNNGLHYGFLRKFGNEYLLPTQQYAMCEIDGGCKVKKEPDPVTVKTEPDDEDDDNVNDLDEYLKVLCSKRNK